MQDNATARTAKNSFDILDEVFGKQVIRQGLWLP
jgi:hypothetical protein